mgnify:CR=1 FL=1
MNVMGIVISVWPLLLYQYEWWEFNYLKWSLIVMKYMRNLLIYLSFLWLLVLNFSFINLFVDVDVNNLESVSIATVIALTLWGGQFFAIRFLWNKKISPNFDAQEKLQSV